MAAGEFLIFHDLMRSKFVRSSKSSGASDGEFVIRDLFHQEAINIVYQALIANPLGNQTSAPYTVADISGASLDLRILKIDGTVLAGSPTFTPDADANTLSGTLDLHTTNMETAFGAGAGSPATVSAVISFKFSGGTGSYVYERPITIKRQYNVAGTPSASTADKYYTQAEIDSLFVKFNGNPAGASVTLTSASGTYNAILRCNDDGTFGSNVV